MKILDRLKAAWLPFTLIAIGMFVLASPTGAFAAEVRSGPNASIAPGETINDDLFAGGGQTVTIGGHVTGDAYAIGESVVVTGSIDGDLIAAAQRVVVDGNVDGNVRAAGATVTINGTVGRSITAAAQHIDVTSNGRIGGSVVAAGENVDSFGQVGRGMTIGGGTLQLAGPVGGPVMARVQTLTVAPTARIAGNLDYQAKQEASLPSGAVSGAVSFTSAPQQAPQPAPLLNGLFDLGGLIALVGTFLIGALAIILAPRAAARANELGRQQPWLSFGLGLVVLVCVPVAAVLVAITLVGIPVAVCLIAVYVLGFLLAWPAVGLVVGTQLTRLVRADRPRPVLGALALGLIVLHLVSHVPFIGGLVALCAIVFGLGLEIQALRRWRRPTEQPRDTAPMAMAA